jgi:hypothetical protein
MAHRSTSLYDARMIIPLWAVFGLLSATLSAGVMLGQERFKLDGFVMAFWIKVATVCLMLPMVVMNGVPDNPYFYMFLAAQACLWMICDVIFYNAIPKVGAGVVSRILPVSTILAFCLWFAVDHKLLSIYLETPWRSGGVFVMLCATSYFAMRMRKCNWANPCQAGHAECRFPARRVCLCVLRGPDDGELLAGLLSRPQTRP